MKSTASSRSIGGDIREKRQSPRFPAKLPVQLMIKNKPGSFCGRTVNVSKGGICISLNKEIDGRAETILRINTASNPINISVSLRWQSYDEKRNEHYAGMEFGKSSALERLNLKKLLKEIEERVNLNRNFIDIIDEFKDFLEGIESSCRNFDSHEPTDKQKILYIKQESPEIYSEFDNFWIKLNNITKGFEKNKFELHKKYLQKKILYYFIRESAPLNKQVYVKPLGYAGDYVIANYFYQDSYLGSTTYGKLINRYSMYIPIGRAYTDRKDYLRNILLSAAKKNSKKINISSFACGPAAEVLELLDLDINLDNVYFNLIDGEKAAIKYIEKRLKNTGGKANIFLFTENIISLINGHKRSPIKYLSQDLIYCAGFIDYLMDRTVIRTIRYLYSLLKEKGEMVIGCMTAGNPHKFFMEVIGEWNLHYRDKRQLLDIAHSALPEAENIRCEYGKTTRDAYLIVTK